MLEHGKVTTLVKVRTPGPHVGESGFEGKDAWLQGLQTSPLHWRSFRTPKSKGMSAICLENLNKATSSLPS